MKSSTLVMLASAAVGQALQQCSGTAKEEGGNWWCGAVDQILYSNVGHPGTYKAVNHMGDDGSCTFDDVPFSGPLAPFNEELVPVFRGPMNLKQVAIYSLSPKAKRSAAVSHNHARRHGHHGHQHLHKKHAEEEHNEEKRGDVWVTATIDGIVQSWINNWHGPTPEVAPPVNTPVVPPVVSPSPTPTPSKPAFAAAAVPKPASSKASSSKAAGSSSGTVTGDYTRVGYYNADKAIADGIVFLGNYGGQGSGKFDNVFGNSLSYLNSDATGGAASPQVLNPVTLKSNQEFLIASDKSCDDGSCGYSRPGSVAYHGFKGEDSVWLFELNMPLDGTSGFNADMSALWFLNARIPRTAQYNKCSCWPDCGELDILEVLAPGDTKCKSTFHSNVPGGSSDYFDRPTGEPVKVAVVLDGDSGQVSVKILSNDVDFSTGLSRSQVESWLSADSFSIASAGGKTNRVSLFALSS
ncbi:TOS1 protein [Colletotrichum tofieldiae]|uniref:glucan endo-1,3-beta-D-glucosidase n=1 Tax=Colletotrichum tofieldiae TaxID=708197 RepID=A0A161VE76_9PEZI|nr:TOS1 protein [Colletotrichum tofieldiae]GKT64478.1 TOS1 protein [Colletotrichum tofieldiae]GKT74447.1 TOS1 protein [Colletotrichum tofieldiae]